MADPILQQLEEVAKQNPKRIAFPESDNETILQAAAEVLARGIATPLLVGSQQAIQARAQELGISTEGFTYYDNTDEAAREALAAEYTKRNTGENALSDKAVKRKSKNPLSCAMLLAKAGMADGVAAGRDFTTGEVIYAAVECVGFAPGFNTVSSLGVLDVPGFEGPEGQLLAIADCAVNPAPDAAELADIALASANTMETLLGWEPRVAMLAFSTLGSAEHPSIEPIREAIEICRQRRPELKIDGEFQLDAAINPKVAASKVKKESDVAGKANVLIFPNLHAGNIGVKLVQTFGKADAYGPVLQGFALPVCDFSRGAPLSEIMGNLVMLVVRAQKNEA